MILNCRRVALAYSEEKVIFGLHPGKACVRHHNTDNPHCHIVYNRINNEGKLSS